MKRTVLFIVFYSILFLTNNSMVCFAGGAGSAIDTANKVVNIASTALEFTVNKNVNMHNAKRTFDLQNLNAKADMIQNSLAKQYSMACKVCSNRQDILSEIAVKITLKQEELMKARMNDSLKNFVINNDISECIKRCMNNTTSTEQQNVNLEKQEHVNQVLDIEEGKHK